MTPEREPTAESEVDERREPAAAPAPLGDLAPQVQQPVRGPGGTDVTDQQQ